MTKWIEPWITLISSQYCWLKLGEHFGLRWYSSWIERSFWSLGILNGPIALLPLGKSQTWRTDWPCRLIESVNSLNSHLKRLLLLPKKRAFSTEALNFVQWHAVRTSAPYLGKVDTSAEEGNTGVRTQTNRYFGSLCMSDWQVAQDPIVWV